MIPGAGIHCSHRVVLTGTPRCVDLGRDVVAAHLGLTPKEAAQRLSRAPSVLAEALAPDAARRLVRLLRLLGLPARCETVGTGDKIECRTVFDLAIQPTAGAPAREIAARLSERLDRPQATFMTLLHAPGGLVVTDLTWQAVAGWRTDRALSRAQILVSESEGAAYDVLPWYRPDDQTSVSALARHLRVLGLAPCPLTGAVAAGIDRTMAAHLIERFPRAGLLCVNRDFQRFDLVMTAAPGLSPRELADFLTTRTGQSRVVPGATCTSAPEAIDCALTRSDALAFQADYALIGIETRLRLVSGSRDRR